MSRSCTPAFLPHEALAEDDTRTTILWRQVGDDIRGVSLMPARVICIKSRSLLHISRIRQWMTSRRVMEDDKVESRPLASFTPINLPPSNFFPRKIALHLKSAYLKT
jgi:hypothetical protein